MLSFSQMQSQGIVPPVEPEVAPLGVDVSTKGSCVDPSGQDPNIDALGRRGLYVDDNPPRLVSFGRVYEWSTIMRHVYHVPLGNDLVKVGVEEV